MKLVDQIKVRFSLIIASYGEAAFLERCLGSLVMQTFQSFEIIIVDQNDDDRLRHLISSYSTHLRLLHLRSPRGLSKARNLGILHSSGQILTFPDDDCWFDVNLLDRVNTRLCENLSLSGLSGCCVSPEGHVLGKMRTRNPCYITRGNVWNCALSASLFIQRAVFDDIGVFDEDLGLGAQTRFQSGEETDLIMRALDAHHMVFFDPSFAVLHPVFPSRADKKAISQARLYGAGMGRVLRKHNTSSIRVLIHIVKPLFGAAIAVTIGRLDLAHLRLNRAIGRMDGWSSFGIKKRKGLRGKQV